MREDILVVAYVPVGRQDIAMDLVAEVGRDYLETPPEPGKDWYFQFDSEQLLQQFLQGWERLGIDSSEPYVRWLRKYSHSELMRAPLLRVRIDRASKGMGGAAYGTRYDLSRACSRCGTGARQKSPLNLKPSEVERKGDVTQTLSNECLVSNSVADMLRDARVSGMELRPVESTRPERPIPWVQVIATEELAPMAQETRGIIVENQCPVCRRDGFFTTVKHPEEIIYSSRDVDPSLLPDVVRTWEHFGNSILKEPFSDSRFAQPLYLIKPRVYEIFRKNRVRGMVFSPVNLI